MTTVSVTAEHIADGEPNSSWGCPVALALADAFPDAEHVSVGMDEVDIEMADYERDATVSLPPEAVGFIFAFDHQRPVEPFTFTVDYPAVTP